METEDETQEENRPLESQRGENFLAISIEPTDEELRAQLDAKRAEWRALGLMTEYVPENPRGLAMNVVIPSTATWDPPCTSCHEPIGYTAPDGKYIGATECAKCMSGTVAQRLMSSGISGREMGHSLDELKPHGPDGKPYTDYARWMEYLRKFAGLSRGVRLNPPFAFACGTNGVGKSAGAQRALRDAINNGCQGRYLRLDQLIQSIYDTFGTDESTMERQGFYANVPLLVIDEIGQGKISDMGMTLFFQLVDDRWSKQRATIFISNYLPKPESLGARITEEQTAMKSILDRICGGSRANLFIIRGASWRGKEHEQ